MHNSKLIHFTSIAQQLPGICTPDEEQLLTAIIGLQHHIKNYTVNKGRSTEETNAIFKIIMAK
jgi:NADH:ubiquinone oxidoreductase subunit B-like Fe-S oxidoreductase